MFNAFYLMGKYMTETIILICVLFVMLISTAWLLKTISVLSHKTNIKIYKKKEINNDDDD